MQRICVGIPYYGTQDASWWSPLAGEMARLHLDNIELVQMICIGGMKTDAARNSIVEAFLETDAEWLMWVDADNVIPLGLINRLLSTHKSLVTGVYVKRTPPHEPIMYTSTPDGMYEAIKEWTVGEILPVDTAGLGGCLSHRSVFLDIRKNYRVLERTKGGVITVHKDDIVGDVFDTLGDDDGKVIDGIYHDRIRLPKYKHPFPYFMMEYGRTEDYFFFENAARSGHQLWADTSAELGHIGFENKKPERWRAHLAEMGAMR